MIIRAIDLETTGIPTETDPHAIVEIGWCDYDGRNVGSPNSVLCNPGRQIPHEAMAVHHISDRMVANATGDLSVLGSPDYFAAHNADYERQFFKTEIPFICTYKVALRLWPEAPSHALQFLRYYLSFHEYDESPYPEEPHRAGPDAWLCAILLKRELDENSGHSIDDFVRWSNGPALLPRVNFGKHKGSKWEDVPTDYLEWLVFKSDMDKDVKANAKHHLGKRKNG